MVNCVFISPIPAVRLIQRSI